MHYFEKMTSAFGGFAPRPHRQLPLDPAGGHPSFRPSLPTPGKKIPRVPMFMTSPYLRFLSDQILIILFLKWKRRSLAYVYFKIM